MHLVNSLARFCHERVVLDRKATGMGYWSHKEGGEKVPAGLVPQAWLHDACRSSKDVQADSIRVNSTNLEY